MSLLDDQLSYIELKIENEKLKDCLRIIPPYRIRLLAQWLDQYDIARHGRIVRHEVQTDLRKLADESEKLLST